MRSSLVGLVSPPVIGRMSLWDKALDFLVSTIGQSTFDSWRNRNNVDNYLFELRAALPKAELLIERAECWRLPKYNPIDKHLCLLKDSVYEAKSIFDEFKYQSLKKKVEENFAGTRSFQKWIENWMSDFPTTVKRVIERLNIVYNEMKEICDSRGIPENPNQFSQNARPNTSKFLASKVYGRDTVLNEVIHLMGIPSSKSRKRKRAKKASVSYSEIGESSSRMDKKQNVSVLSIVGMGGIGKTTLAQMVCNNKTVKSFFNLIMWVCVSDNFNKEELTKEMIESATKKECNVNNLDTLQEALQEALNSKKFLLVLDDVWSKDWQDLLAPMEGASEGSVVLVTTRSPKCVKILGMSIGSKGVINLEGIEEHMYWEFFKSCAFDSVAESNNINPDLKAIGKEICKKLKGSPLAAITIGGTLKNNSGVEHWTNIKDSKMWELQKEEHDILPVLQLSYQYLPSDLKKCFSFCSLYPKDFRFTQSELTKFWMMQGFITPNNDKEALTLANTYFVELLRRGFFQALARETYVIHDLMHDVCLSITKDECFCFENGYSEQKVSLDIRHASVFEKVSLKEQMELCKYQKLLSLKVRPNSCCTTGIETWCNAFKHIRSLSLARCKIKKLPENIGNLKHLLFLDISGTSFKTLPKSFCNLYSLQYLNMMDCSKIECFPEGFYKLVNLHFFYLPFEMVSLVERFGNIVKAIQLYNLKLSLSNIMKIEILKDLVQLSGSLCITNLQYVHSKEAAQKAQLSNKTLINRLVLEWSMNCDIGNEGEDYNEVLDGLCPNHKLKELKMSCYRGRNLSPSWLKEEFLPNLTEVEFQYCMNVSTISHLPRFITKLVIHWLSQLENLQNLLEPNHLPALNHIELKGCVNQELLSVELFGGFASLEKLIIAECPKLRSPNAMVLPPSVKYLELGYCGDLEKSIPSCLQNLTSLETLNICSCYRFESIPAEVTSNLKSLSKLQLMHCTKLQSLGGHQFLECLQEVRILECPKLDVTRGQDINGKLPSALLEDRKRRTRSKKISH
ncbi:putative disease resistance protein RGA3 [Carex rostrata]